MNNNEMLKLLKPLFTNIILYLYNIDAVKLIETDKGIFIKENKDNGEYVYIEKEYVDLPRIKELNLKIEKSILKEITPVNKLFESFETMLCHHPTNESINYGRMLEEAKNEILKNQRVSKHKLETPRVNLKGSEVYQIIGKNERYILIKNYPINTKITYEEPMVNNLSKLWGGYKLHRNFVIIKLGLNGYNLLCEFDAIGVKDDILCFFEIKNKCADGNFLERVYNTAPYFVEWLKKNNYDIKYVAPIYYLREDVEYSSDKINVIYYKDILDKKPIVINKYYKLNKIGGFDIESPLNDEIRLSKEILYEEIPNDIENIEAVEYSSKSDESQPYYSVNIKNEQYKKIERLLCNTKIFNSLEDFINFAVDNAINTIELLKK